MGVCARAVLQADGSYFLALDPAETNPATCAYVVETGSEYSIGSLATLTPDEALTISGAVAGLWAVAWGIRQVAQLLSIHERSYDE